MLNNVVQSNYSPNIRPAVEGMLADETGYEISTYLCGTSGGILFGRAVSLSSSVSKTAILGGAAYIGVTVRDITNMHVGQPAVVDQYVQYENMAVLSRGHIWLRPQADVAPNDPVYYSSASGLYGNSASGLAGTGQMTFTQIPVDGQTVTIDGTALTFRNAPGSATEVQIGPSVLASVANLAAVANASADANLVLMEYAAEGNEFFISDKSVGTGGNALAISTTVPNTTLSGATLTGGTASATQVTGARWLTGAVGGDLAIAAFGIQS